MGKPQDLPAGETQLYTALSLNFVTYVLALISFTGFGGAVMHAAIDLACTGLFLYLGLRIVGRLPRFEQAYGAICGAGAVLNLAAIPLLQLTMVPEGGTPSSLAIFARFLLLVWSLSLVGHVLRHTFSIRMFTSILIAVIYYVLITTVLGWVFPSAESADQVSGMVQELGFVQYAG